MGGYIGAKVGKLVTTAANVSGDATIGGNLTVKGTTVTVDSATAQTVDLGDNDKIRLGDGDDLQLYHDGTHSHISNATGDLSFDLAGDFIIDVDGGDVKFKDDGTEFSQYYKDGNDLAIYSSISDGDIKFQGLDGGSVITPVTIDMSEGGKVGIAGNTAPKESLNSGAIIVEGDHATGVNAMGSSAGLLLHATGDTGFVTATSNGSNNRNLQLRALSTGAANANQLFLSYTGNVGIKHSNPTATLNVGGTNPYVWVEGDSNSYYPSIRLTGVNGGISLGTYYGGNISGNTLNFRTGANTNDSGSFVFLCDASRNLLFQCTSAPDANHYGIGFIKGSSNDHFIRSSVGSTGAVSHHVFYNPNGYCGQIYTSSSSTSFITSSDYRIKENVVNIDDGITRVKQLAPKRFNFIADADTTVDGFLAHEAQEVVPEAVTGTKDAMMDEEYTVTAAKGDVVTPATDETDEVIHSSDVEQPDTLEEGQVWRETAEAVTATRTVPDYQGIDQAKLVPLLTAALQEAIAKIEILETKVAALEG